MIQHQNTKIMIIILYIYTHTIQHNQGKVAISNHLLPLLQKNQPPSRNPYPSSLEKIWSIHRAPSRSAMVHSRDIGGIVSVIRREGNIERIATGVPLKGAKEVPEGILGVCTQMDGWCRTYGFASVSPHVGSRASRPAEFRSRPKWAVARWRSLYMQA